MHYSETTEQTTKEDKRKLLTVLVLLCVVPVLFAATGYWLWDIDRFWSVFAWIGAAMLLVLVVFRLVHYIKEDFYRHKIVYNGNVLDVQTTKMGYGTTSSTRYEFTLEKATLRIGERALYELNLVDVPLPAKGEDVEIHCLPRSQEIIRLLVFRNGEWKSVVLK